MITFASVVDRDTITNMARQQKRVGRTLPNEWSVEQKLLARRLFKLRILEAKGSEYQRLFERVMQYRYPNDFISIKPYGNVGDRKNDGYCPSSGTYHQVYAPERPTAPRSVVAAAKKATEDFAGLKRAWDRTTPIKVFRFVFNDEYRNCPPDIAIACAALAKEHGIKCSPLLAHHLEDEAMQLQPDQISDILQAPIPRPESIPNVDFSVLGEVIRHVLENPIPISKESILSAPDFTEKIEFNGLSAPVGHLLHSAGRQIEAVNDFFSLNSNFAKQELRNKLNALYMESKKSFASKARTLEFGDLVFFDLLRRMVPFKSTISISIANAQNAALVVMGFYFESCDVFETPQ